MYTIVRIWNDIAHFWTFAAVKLRATYNWEVALHYWMTGEGGFAFELPTSTGSV
jgi:hypothetical protein